MRPDISKEEQEKKSDATSLRLPGFERNPHRISLISNILEFYPEFQLRELYNYSRFVNINKYVKYYDMLMDNFGLDENNVEFEHAKLHIGTNLKNEMEAWVFVCLYHSLLYFYEETFDIDDSDDTNYLGHPAWITFTKNMCAASKVFLETEKDNPDIIEPVNAWKAKLKAKWAKEDAERGGPPEVVKKYLPLFSESEML